MPTKVRFDLDLAGLQQGIVADVMSVIPQAVGLMAEHGADIRQKKIMNAKLRLAEKNSLL
jgi:hypothetical protein